MDFGKAARQTMKDPYAIRRVEESNTRIKPISHDDIINIKINLELYSQDILDFIARDGRKDDYEEEECLDSLSLL